MSLEKENIINLYKDIINAYYQKNKSYDLTANYLEKLKLNKKDYEDIIDSLPIENKHILFATETEQIINTLKQTVKHTLLEYNDSDIEPVIYCNIGNNITLLTNFDIVENKWYLSSIKTDDLKLIKEIYSGTYDKFINYIKTHTLN